MKYQDDTSNAQATPTIPSMTKLTNESAHDLLQTSQLPSISEPRHGDSAVFALRLKSHVH